MLFLRVARLVTLFFS